MKTKFSGILTLFLAFLVQITFAQEKTITGVVSDENGVPLPAATVLIEGTATGVSTDFDGIYAIQAKQGDKISYSYVGYVKQVITLGTETKINIKLVQDNTLEEVVVVGYTTSNKEKVSGAISVVKAEKLEQIPIASFDQILQGQAAGLQVSAGSGQPGSAARVRIRGNGSINGSNDPLYIVDGVQITAGDYAALNPNDFNSVSVLKDASATAPYGSRGANGVIVITTKKGTYDQPLTVQYRTQFGVATAGEAPFEVMDTRELLRFQRTIGRFRGAGLTDQQIEDIANETDTDWSDVFLRSAKTSSHDLSISGGNKKSRYFSSLGYYNQEGIAIRSNLQRFTLRNNFEHTPNEKTKIGVNSTIGFTKSNFIDSEGAVALANPYAAVYLGSPYDAPYNADGSVNTGPGLTGGNALERLLRDGRSQNELKIVGNVYAEREIFKNVTAKVNIGLDYSQENDIRFVTPDTFAGGNVTPGGEGLYNESNRYNAVITNTNSINYSNVFNDKHTLTAGAYLEFVKTHFRSGAFTGYGINPLTNGYVSSTTPGTPDNELIPVIGGTNTERGLFSYFGLADYDYDSRYGFSASLRRDASSKFADNNKWGTFYSVAGRWNISNEDFMDSAGFVNSLKLRASYGTSGNQDAIADFSDSTVYGQVSYNGQSGIAPGRIGNPDLVWETSTQLNVGLDFDFFKNSLVTGSVEYYNNVTSDLFVNFTLSAASGVPSISANAGEMRNAGFDVDLNFNVINKEDVKLTLFGNVNYNKNEILDLGQVNEFEQGTSIIREGLPLGSHFAVGWAGVNPANGEPLYYDLDGNVTNVFSSANATANHGSFNPEYTGGFGFNFNYKGWQVSSLFSYAAEYFRFNNQTFFGENPNFAGFNQLAISNTIWQQPGDITEVQSFLYPRQFSSKDIEDASYTRFRNLTVAYNFPTEVLKATKYIKKLRLYGQAQNLYTWTNFTGFDPEDDNNIAQYEYPTPRTFTVGLDISF